MCFHVDDLKGSHVQSSVNSKFIKWLNKKYGSYGEVKATRGKVHEYLGMTLDFSDPGKVSINMTDYVASMVDDFSVKLEKNLTLPQLLLLMT